MRSYLLPIVLIGVSGCHKIQVGTARLSPADVCPAFEQYDCLPTPGPSLTLGQYQTAIPLINDEPRWDDFVGRVRTDGDVTGQAPTRDCAVSTMFSAQDMDIGYADTRIKYEGKLVQEFGTTASADIVQAAAAAGVTGALLNRVKAAVESTFANDKTRTISGTARYRTAMLKPEVLRGINMGADRFAACRDYLRANPTFDLVRAISGFHIDAASANTDTKNAIEASLKAGLSFLPEQQLASLAPSFSRVATLAVETILKPRFHVYGITYFDLDN